MDPRSRSRRRRLATLMVVLPILTGIAIALLAHFLGSEGSTTGAPAQVEPQRRIAAAAAAAGSPAPRVRLEEGATGRPFDSASLKGMPYAVVFISTRCDAIGGFLSRAAGELKGEKAAILAISDDPGADSRASVRAWLRLHHIPPDGQLHYLLGSEEELRGLWNAWGLDGPSAACGETVPAHLVSGTGVNTGIIDLDPQASPTSFTATLAGPSP